MTSAHIFFIPVVMLVGLVLGIALGRRSAFLQIEEENKQKKREADKRARAESPPPSQPPSQPQGPAAA